MWKRHTALNALVGDNTSAMRTNHMGSPLFTGGGLPAAPRHCGELRHLVNTQKGEVRGVDEQYDSTSSSFFSFSFLSLLGRDGERNMGSEIARCLVKKA